jgi:ABC-type uncharacterized transport system ATPase subunit
VGEWGDADDHADACASSDEVQSLREVFGNGQRELVEVLGGQRPATTGEMHVLRQSACSLQASLGST